MTKIHPTAIIADGACIAPDAEIGPYCVIGPHVVLGAGVKLVSHVVVDGLTEIGSGTVVYPFASLGHPPQDLKYKGEPSRLIIGCNNQIREHVTMNPGTEGGGMETVVGDNCLFMMATHVAHDCHVGNHVIMANGASLAGHVRLNSHAILGGFTLVHQFTQIGQYSFAAMGSAITQDIPPFVMVGGRPTRPHGINSVGMERNGISPEDIRLIRKAYKMIYKMNLRMDEAIDQMEDLAGDSKELSDMVSFLRNVTRGILR